MSPALRRRAGVRTVNLALLEQRRRRAVRVRQLRRSGTRYLEVSAGRGELAQR